MESNHEGALVWVHESMAKWLLVKGVGGGSTDCGAGSWRGEEWRWLVPESVKINTGLLKNRPGALAVAWFAGRLPSRLVVGYRLADGMLVDCWLDGWPLPEVAGTPSHNYESFMVPLVHNHDPLSKVACPPHDYRNVIFKI